MFTALSRKAARGLSPAARRRARAIIDPLLASIGSIKRARTATDLVALTFDDGPDPLVTRAVLELLAKRGSSATFFVLVEQARRHPELVRRIVAEGHEVGLHSDNHDRLTGLPLRQLRHRLIRARAALEQLTGSPVRLMRPPFGSQTVPSFLVSRLAGFDVVAWGPCAEDWVEQPAEQAAAKLLDGVRGGDIALLHDGLHVEPGDARPSFDRARMVELILDGLAARGLAATSVGRMIGAAGVRRTAWFRP